MSKKTRRKKAHGPRYKLKGKPRAYVIRDKAGRFKKWTNWRRGTVIDAAFKAKHADKPGYGHRKDYPRKKKTSPQKQKPVGFFTKGRGKNRKVIPIMTATGRKRRSRGIVRVKKKEPRKSVPSQVKDAGKPGELKIPKKPKARPKAMTHIEKTHLLAACKKFGIDPQEIDNEISYYENKKHLQELARMKGFSEAEVTSSTQEMKEWTGQYERYLSNLRNELEGAGYAVTAPTM